MPGPGIGDYDALRRQQQMATRGAGRARRQQGFDDETQRRWDLIQAMGVPPEYVDLVWNQLGMSGRPPQMTGGTKGGGAHPSTDSPFYGSRRPITTTSGGPPMDIMAGLLSGGMGGGRGMGMPGPRPGYGPGLGDGATGGGRIQTPMGSVSRIPTTDNPFELEYLCSQGDFSACEALDKIKRNKQAQTNIRPGTRSRGPRGR